MKVISAQKASDQNLPGLDFMVQNLDVFDIL